MIIRQLVCDKRGASEFDTKKINGYKYVFQCTYCHTMYYDEELLEKPKKKYWTIDDYKSYEEYLDYCSGASWLKEN